MAITKVTEGVRTLGTGEVATANMATDPTNASNLSSGDVPLAQLGNVDNSAVLNDIATLALHSAVQNNQAAYNLSNAFIDQYEDGSGIDAETDTIRDSSGEYIWAATSGTEAFTSDSNTLLLLHMDGANDGTTFTDSSSNTHTVTPTGGVHTDTGTKKLGTASCQYIASPANYLTVTADTMFQRTGDLTVEFWLNSTSSTHTAVFDYRGTGSHANQDNNLFMDWAVGGAGDELSFWIFSTERKFVLTDIDDGNWHHIALVRDSDVSWYLYYDGVSKTPESGAMTHNLTDQINNNNEPLIFGQNFPHNAQWIGYMDELRYSDSVRYPGGTTFVPNFAEVASASGNYTSSTQTASETVSEMGIVVLYTNTSGTASLNTDLIAAVSADGGSNYTTTTLTSAGTFSTGVNIAVANSVSISNTGTAPKYKISFANQSAGVKETRVNGSALLY